MIIFTRDLILKYVLEEMIIFTCDLTF